MHAVLQVMHKLQREAHTHIHTQANGYTTVQEWRQQDSQTYTHEDWIHLPDIHPTQAQVNSPALSDQLKAFQIGLG